MNEQELIKNFESYLKQREQLIVLVNQTDGILNFLKTEIEKIKKEDSSPDLKKD